MDLPGSEHLANRFLIFAGGSRPQTELKEQTRSPMINLNEIKITPRDQDVLRLLVQGCSNKEIASHLDISPRTVKHRSSTEQVQPCYPVIG
jgi:DNA-binding NarL/FixJ family response regulator